MLARRRPDDGVLGEEGTANRDGTTGLRWVVDPLDGTVNYLSGIPLWCVSIACEDAAGTLAGVVYDPLREQTVLGRPRRHRCAPTAAARGSASTRAWRRPSSPAASRARPMPRPSAPASSTSGCSAGSAPRRALGTAALELAWTAAGRLDVCYHEQRIHPWDVDAGLFICQRGGPARAPAGAARRRPRPALPRGARGSGRRGARAGRPGAEGAPPRRRERAAQRGTGGRRDAPPHPLTRRLSAQPPLAWLSRQPTRW